MSEPTGRRIAVGALLIAIVLILPAAARAATPWSVSAVADYGGALAAAPALYDNGNATLDAHAGTNAISVEVFAPGGALWLVFTGDGLASGVHGTHVEASHGGSGCGFSEGTFEIKDLAALPDGTIQRLWLTFEQHCDGDAPALFGEVRIGLPVVTIPSTISWPARELNRPSTVVTETFVAP